MPVRSEKDALRVRVMRLARAQNHMMDARARLLDAGERELAEAQQQLIEQLQARYQIAFKEAGPL